MTRDPTLPHRFEALDALRGVCALLVVLFHIPVHHVLKDSPAFANLQICVDVFFTLSGFVLYHAYGRRLASRAEAVRFLGRRVLRLWPLHVAMLGLFVGLETAKLAYGRADGGFAMDAEPFSTGHTLYELATNLAFVQSFGLHPGMSWNGPAWSAAVEFHVSVLFAGLLIAFPRRRLAAFLALCLASGLALALVSPQTSYVSHDWGILRAAFGFFAGCLVCAARGRVAERLPGASLWEAGSLTVLVAAGLFLPQGGWQFLFLPAICAVIAVFSFQQGAVSSLLRHRWLQVLGLWSYSIYMIHSFLFQIMKTAATFVGRKTGSVLTTWHHDEKLVLIGSPEQALLPALLICVVLVVPVAALTYRFVERPGMMPSTWSTLARRLRRRTGPAPLAVSA